ncbi:FeoA family protein [Vibrio nigripulchritudo]|uniref:FeoA family protein n=1 Tax=Vibrio nigripulchritudo TaxID=28173 RepID=UPI0003B19C9E|nr:FeoA family protein [Vibrio nigripulchritudo]CCN72997.1 putative Fe2+ transport system protein A [Vibrio nigripulchritudo SFn118]
MKLSEMGIGDNAKVTSLGNLTQEIRKKLMVMGMLPDTQIKLVRIAPMGDPLQVEVRGVVIAMRENLAQQVEVEVA